MAIALTAVYDPGTGLLVLEMQERIMRFLVDCCKLIMHDIEEDKLI